MAFVEQGLYTNPEQFLEIAAFNQVALEQGLKPEEVVARGHRLLPDPSGQSGGVDAQATGRVSRPSGPGRSSVGAMGRLKAPRLVQEEEVTEVLTRLSSPRWQEGYPQIVRASVRPDSERLWGQVNRLFPLKVVCRWLAVVNMGKSAWEHYDIIGERMPGDAATLGSALERLDAVASRKRDELLSTGLPRRGNLASVDRFLSQFVARTTRSGEIYPGAICQYALAEFDGDRVALTDRGLELARLGNPILDGDPGRAASTLSDEERTFFMHQVLQYVPGELRDVRNVLNAVLGGRTTPDELLVAVRSLLPAEWSQLMARTHVSGLVARLSDMGLLRRQWQGRNVKYEASGIATTILSREQGAPHGQAD